MLSDYSQFTIIRASQNLMSHNDFLHNHRLREFCNSYKENDKTISHWRHCTPTSTLRRIDLTAPSGTHWMEENVTCEERRKAVKMWLKNDGKLLFAVLCTCKMNEQVKNLAKKRLVDKWKIVSWRNKCNSRLNVNVGDFSV